MTDGDVYLAQPEAGRARGETGVGVVDRQRVPRLTVPRYATAVASTGLVLLIWVCLVQVPAIDWTSWDLLGSYVLAVLLFVGELRPLLVAKRDGEADRITVSTTFAVALVLVGPLALALVAQSAAIIVDDVLRRRSLLKAAFNVGQYLITLTLTRAVFCLASGTAFTEPLTQLESKDLPAALLAAAAYFVINNGLVAVVLAIESGGHALEILRSDLRVQPLTSAIMLGLAPVTAVAAAFSPFMLPLLVLPMLGVQHSAVIAERRQYEALHDELTGLPNRMLFHLRAERAVARSADDGGCVGVMLLDLDHFKEVNDTLGHHVGDGLLRQVAGRLLSGVPEDVLVARLGGDEFAVLVPVAPGGVADVVALAERLSARLREPVMADGVRVGVQASIGIAVRPDHAASVETLLQRADIALYRAKDARGEVQVYRTEIDQHTILRLSLLGDLNSAVDHDEFELVYQPQVDTVSGRVVAVEALMRWRHPAHGLLSPDVFIPLAENTGAIGAMSRAATRTALTTLAGLRRAGHDVTMAVNVSARLLSDLELPVWVGRYLVETGVPASCLTIEVTESTIAADPRRAMQVLQDLRESGVRLSVDDFGTGYSSLSYLRRLQPDEIKVDRSFVGHMRDDENCAVIVRSTIDLGHGLGLSVVAEGVEDQATYDALDALGADRIQGFHVARPMSATALGRWLLDSHEPIATPA